MFLYYKLDKYDYLVDLLRFTNMLYNMFSK